MELLWCWANDPQTRAASVRSEPIPWADHVTWFAGKLAEPGCRIYVGEREGGVPGGVVRFDTEGTAAVVSVTVAPELRGRGLSAELIASATEVFLSGGSAVRVLAYVKDGNAASLRAFARAGFVATESARPGLLCLVRGRVQEPA